MTRIVYITWPATEITGGIKSAFHHVEALRQAGFDAAIASNDTTPPGWFETPLEILPLSAVRRGADRDIVVLPENHPGFLERFADWPNRKVVLCLNHFFAHRGLGKRRGYGDYGVSELIVAGVAPATFCRQRFPDLDVHIVPPFIDPDLFAPRERKALAVCLTARKRRFEAAFIKDLFRACHAKGLTVRWIELNDASQADMADAFASSAVHLSLGRFESVGRTPLEAMSAGCVCTGFLGFGGREYATDYNGFWAAEDDLIDCARQLGRAVRLAADGGPLYHETLQAGFATARRYSRDRFTAHLTDYWTRAVDAAGGGRPAAAEPAEPAEPAGPAEPGG